MKIKHLMIVGLMLAILTIGAVSASENVTSDDLAVEEEIDDSVAQIDDSNEEEIIAAQSNDEPLGDSFNSIGEGIYGEIYTEPSVSKPSEMFTVALLVINDTTNSYGKTLKVLVDNESKYSHNITGTDYVYLSNRDLGITDYKDYRIDIMVDNSIIASSIVHIPFLRISTTNVYEGYYYPCGEIIAYTIMLPETATGKLTLTVNGKTYDVNYKKGIGNVYVDTVGWQLANYTATASYGGDDKYNASTLEATVQIVPRLYYPGFMPMLTSMNYISVGEDDCISVSVPEGTPGIVEITIQTGSAIYKGNFTFSSGYGSYSLADLPEGPCQVRLNGSVGTFPIDIVFNMEVIRNNDDYTSSISATEIVEGSNVNVKISGPYDGRVAIFVDDVPLKSFMFKDEIDDIITGLTLGTHKIRVMAQGYNGYYFKTFHVTVKQKPAPEKETVKMTLKKVKVKKSAKKLVLTSTLKINGKAVKGKIIKFKFNKKTYSAKTDAKGIAKVTIKKAVLKKLKAGKKITYQASYSKTVKKITVKVMK